MADIRRSGRPITLSTSSRERSSTIDVLARDWQRAVLSGRVAAAYLVWREAEPALARFRHPTAVVSFMRGPAAPAEKDAVLCALLRRAKREPLAGLMVFELLRPGVLNLLARLTRGARDRDELRSVLLCAVWEGIRAYPLARRPRRVAANLLLDALHRTLVEVGQESKWRAVWLQTTVPASTGGAASEHGVEEDVEGVLVGAVRAGALTVMEAELVLASRIDGVPLSELAEAAGVSYNTMKLRRQRAERRLLVFLGFRPVPRGQQKRPSSFARVAGAGSHGPLG